MDMNRLLADFIHHVDAMSDDEVEASIQEALRFSAGCDTDETPKEEVMIELIEEDV